MAIRLEFYSLVMPSALLERYVGGDAAEGLEVWDDTFLCRADGCMNGMDAATCIARCHRVGLEPERDCFMGQEFAVYSPYDLPSWLGIYGGVAWYRHHPSGPKPKVFPCEAGGLYFRREEDFALLAEHLLTLDGLFDEFKPRAADFQIARRKVPQQEGELLELAVPTQELVVPPDSLQTDIRRLIKQSKYHDWGMLPESL